MLLPREFQFCVICKQVISGPYWLENTGSVKGPVCDDCMKKRKE